MNEEDARGDGRVEDEIREDEVMSVEEAEGDELPELGSEEMLDRRVLSLSECVKESMS